MSQVQSRSRQGTEQGVAALNTFQLFKFLWALFFSQLHFMHLSFRFVFSTFSFSFPHISYVRLFCIVFKCKQNRCLHFLSKLLNLLSTLDWGKTSQKEVPETSFLGLFKPKLLETKIAISAIKTLNIVTVHPVLQTPHLARSSWSTTSFDLDYLQSSLLCCSPPFFYRIRKL